MNQAKKVKPFLSLLTSEEAYQRIADLDSLGAEEISVHEALGRVLAEPVGAVDDVPHFFRSNMDGYAVRASDTFGATESSAVALKLAGHVAMGAEATTPIEAGQAFRISTGGMMPPGADAVVIVERTEERTLEGEKSVLIRAAVVPEQNTVAIGEDMRSGDLVLPAGRRIRGSDIGALCGVGRTRALVHRVPRVGIMATGDEIVEPDAELKPGQVRNVNQYLLGAMTRRLGLHLSDYGVIPDDEDVFGETLRRAVAECDAVFISGGSSMGTRDLTLETISGLDRSEVLFHGIAIAPGKPTILAKAADAIVMGLPGNPAAAAVVFTLFGSTLVRRLEGESVERILMTRPSVSAELAQSIASTPGREDYVRVHLTPGQDSGGPVAEGRGPRPLAHPIRGKSVAISTVAKADGLVRIPLSTEGLEEGSAVDVWLL